MKQRSLVLAVALLFVVASVSAAVAAPQQNSFLSNGVKIHYVTDGQGEPVVLIHGFAANAYVNWMMPGIFAKLSKHYHVIRSTTEAMARAANRMRWTSTGWRWSTT